MNFEMNKISMKQAGIIAAVLFLAYLLAHHFFKSSGPTIALPKVVVQQPVWTEVVEYVTQTGTTVAYNSVDLVARVEGYLNSVKFTDGTFVKKGEDLLVIQPEPYMEQLKEAQAEVAAQKADYAYNKSEYARQQRMYKQNATSLNNVEKWLAKIQESEAGVQKAVANEAIARINYGYTHIAAPFDGRIGRHLVDPGNLVGNGVATNLATIEQISPIYIYFNLNELELIKLREAAKARGFKPSELKTIPAYAKLQTETEFKHQGTLDFVNTGLNASTGTMEFRALFENKDYTLLPGLFVQVRVPISKATKQLAIPDTAVQYDQIGPYALIVDADSLAQLIRIEVGVSEQGNIPVTKGLNEQDKVIISGLQFVTPGAKVDIQEPKSGTSENTK